MDIKQPIFIIGVGRSGSTVYFDILSHHAEVSWLSERVLNNFPNKLFLNRFLLHTQRISFVGKLTRRIMEPGECYRFWNSLYRGFSTPFRDLEAQDVTNRARKRISSAFEKVGIQERDRLLLKITGWNRIRFLNEIFPDALFIHVKRDPRAVMNSFLNVEFWSGWRGPMNWRMGEISKEQHEELERFNYSFVALAGIKLELLNKAYLLSKAGIDTSRLLEVQYEDLCLDPVLTMKESVRFCHLDWTPSFENEVKSYNLKNTNFKWKDHLTSEQQEIANYYYEKIRY
ncbi:sulfotransferase [bacterium]|nr:sulfotransferase [bacterium]